MIFKSFFAAALIAGALLSQSGAASADPRVALPEEWSDWVLYRTSDRGSVIEDMYAPKDVMAAMKTAESFPYGTRLLLVEYHSRSGERPAFGATSSCRRKKAGAPFIQKACATGNGSTRPITEIAEPLRRARIR